MPFFLYLLPVLDGRSGRPLRLQEDVHHRLPGDDRVVLLLGQFTSLPSFFMAFMFVAVGAAIFKPVVVGTVAKVTDESNSALGFGIFYMMVNVGGFLGPIVAGVVRGWSWDYVFIACSTWAFINLLIVIFFYKDPTTEAQSAKRRTLRKVLDDSVEVLGNLRFFITVFTVLIALMLAGLHFSWFSWRSCVVFIPAWLVANFVYDLLLPKGNGRPDAPKRHPLSQTHVLRQLAIRAVPADHVGLLDGLQPDLHDHAGVHPRLRRDQAADRGVPGGVGPETWCRR